MTLRIVRSFRWVAGALGLVLMPLGAAAQELEPGAYWPIPKNVTIFTAVNSFNWGDVAFDPAWNFGLSSPGDIEVRFGEQTFSGGSFLDPELAEPHLDLAPHPGWKGHIEV